MRSILFTILLFSITCFSQQSSNKAYEDAAKYSREHRGIAVAVMKDDKIVFEDYAMQGSADLPWMLASGTKSFSGVMCAAAIDDKLISSFDEKVADTITEWKNDPRKSKVTIRQLLSLTSGIDAGQIGSVPSYSEAVTKPAKYDPGTKFEYGPVPFQIFGEVMTRKLKAKNETVWAYMKRRILDPIDLAPTIWRKNEGQPLLPQGAAMTAREWIKFGKLLKDRGKWNGKQLIDAKLLDELVIGSKVNPAYGLTFWLNADGTGPSGGSRLSISGDIGKKLSTSKNIYMAAGAGNQRLYVIPSEDMVVVRFGAFGDYDDREFVTKLLGV
jgi:CubicO group peptidase (beta-lactamase class C family)